MLQGSLDNFTLDEVLNLLAGTHKSGHLRISGDRGTGSLWVDDGKLVQAEASNVTTRGDWEDVMFELLRFESGNFSFVADDLAPMPGDAEEIAPLVEKGNELLSEWQSIEAVIKSPDHFLTVNSALPSDQVMLTASEWETVVAIGEGRTVGKTFSRIGAGELRGCRRIKSVIERGLVNLESPTLRNADSEQDHDLADMAEAAVDSPALTADSFIPSTLSSGSVPNPDETPSNVVAMPGLGVEQAPASPLRQQIPPLNTPTVPSSLMPPTPPPAPPSPDEIRQFSESVSDASPLARSATPPPPPPPPADFATKVNDDGSAAADDEASLLMKYLQSET